MTRAKQVLAALLSIALVMSVGLVATGGFAGAQTQQDTASVSIEDQQSDGETVIVNNVTVPDGGFVVIHESEELDEGDAVGSVIGVSTYLEPGTHQAVPVTMAQELDSTEVEVTAMAHKDTNGNEVFDFVASGGEVDGPYTTEGAQETETPTETETPMETETPTETPEETETPTETPEETETPTETETETPEEGEGGEPVTDTATIDAVGDGAPPTNLQFSDQSSNGTTVTVDRVTLYRGGYVVIHDSEEADGGPNADSVIGSSDYMPPGTYEDITITLADPLDFENETSVNVTAVPHHETNQNLVNDYVLSMGQADGPYMANGTAVTATATITGEETETPMETETPTETPEETETPTETPEETETETEA